MLPFLISHDYSDCIIIGICLVVAITIHEFGHAVAAQVEGDPTARLEGRLSLNPAAHLDPFGALMIVLVGFGWGKPVPIQTANMRSRRFGAAIVGAAGPITNAILAVATAIIARATNLALEPGFGGGGGITLTERLASAFIYLNIILFLLNLIPVPPLDGSRVVSALLPPDKQKYIYFMDRWGFLLLLILALLILPTILGRITGGVDQALLRVVHNQVYGSFPAIPQQRIL
ncbi:MAG: site-2 protease family protein [Actinomycetota bacterium]